MGSLIRDVRYGLRMLARNPGFSVVAIITLALGIGANAALFSVINGVLLKSLPIKDADQVVFLWVSNSTNSILAGTLYPSSSLNYRDWKDQSHVFSQMAGRRGATVSLTGGELPEKIQGEQVTADYFKLLGVEPIAGRAFLPGEDNVGSAPIALLSRSLWQRRFGGDPKVIGQAIALNGQSTIVIGVMPDDYRPNIEFWIPYRINYETADRDLHDTTVLGRLAPGVTKEKAQAEMTTIGARLAQQYPDINKGWDIQLVPVHDSIVQNIRPALLILFAAVGLVLLIACTNVANLMLARAASREREIALKMALGASRLRLVRQVLTESVLLSVIGGALGVAIATWGTKFLINLNPQGIPLANEIGLDYRVLGFTLGAALLSGIIFGLAPALQSTKLNLNETLKESGKSSAGNARGRVIRSTLVVIEVALAFVLMVGAGLLIKSFSRLQEVDPGFNREKVLTFQLSLPQARYREPAQQVNFYKDILQNFASLPGVTSAAVISQAPLAGPGAQFIFSVDGRPIPAPSEAPIASYRVVSPDYFHTLGIPIVAGRPFTEGDKLDSLPVMIVNQSLAKHMWPGEDPVGKHMMVGVPGPGQKPQYSTVVGVVRDIRHTSLSGDPGMQMYQTIFQAPGQGLPIPFLNMTYMLRTALEPMNLAETARKSVAKVDANLPMSNLKTMDTIVYDSVAPFRFNTFLLGLFAGVALILTIIGVYGVMNYSVTQRTQEIGVRMALGAQQSEVLAMILKQGLVLSLIGLAIGLIGALALTNVMSSLSSLLFGVSKTDPTVFIGIPIIMVIVALVACYIPARRATKVDPMIALRYE